MNKIHTESLIHLDIVEPQFLLISTNLGIDIVSMCVSPRAHFKTVFND